LVAMNRTRTGQKRVEDMIRGQKRIYGGMIRGQKRV